MAWWALIGCDDVEQERVVLDEPPPHTAQIDLELYRGRWVAAARLPDGGWAACLESTTLEFRGDPASGFELVGSAGDELRIAPIGAIVEGAGAVEVQLEGEPALHLKWLAPARVATFGEWYGDRAFLSPHAQKVVPRVACP